MADTTFTGGTLIASSWLNDVNRLVYDIGDATSTAKGDALVAVKFNDVNAATRTQHSKNSDVVSILDFSGVDITGGTDSTDAFTHAFASSASIIEVPPGIYQLHAFAGATGKTLRGAGSALVTIKIKSGNTDNIVDVSSKNNFTIQGITFDYTGGGAGTGIGIKAVSCTNLRLEDVVVKSTPGIGIQVVNCPDSTFRDITVTSAVDWGFSLDGASCSRCNLYNLRFNSCTNRGLYMRSSVLCNVFGVTGNGNGGSVLWMTDVLYCNAFGIVDINDVIGDAVAIDGASIGSRIIGVNAKTCGGHTASISSTSGGAPVDCHITQVYSDGAGECMGAITDQGTGNQPVHCSIQGTGKNCGRVTPSEAWAFSNCVDCWIDCSVTDTLGTMTYSVKEGGAAPANNRFLVHDWVNGTSGYFSISSSTSGITHETLQRPRTVVGDANYTWVAATDNRTFLYNTALTTDRTLTLGLSWPGDEMHVYRFAGGAFNLLVKQGGTTIATLGAADTWARLYFDGTNWNKIAS